MYPALVWKVRAKAGHTRSPHSHLGWVWPRILSKFALGALVSPASLTLTASKTQWLTDEPIWVNQWPLTQEKLKIAQQLVFKQFEAGHIEEPLSPWNTLIFVIKKKQSGSWRLLQDLHKINAVTVTMGAPQLGLPSPTMMIPWKHSLIVINLKDCSFSIPLHS